MSQPETHGQGSGHVRTGTQRRSMVVLGLGAAVGVVLAAFGLLQTSRQQAAQLPARTVAQVNGQLIGLDEYQQAVNALAQDRRAGVDAEQRQFALDRLIDQELLLQRALELGLARSDPRARNLITSAMVSAAVADADGVQPSDAQLEAFYDKERALFTDSGRLQVRQIWMRAGNPKEAAAAFERAEQAVTRLRRGEDFATVKAALGDTEIAPLPEAALSATKLGEYLGPTAVRTALDLPEGAVSDPVRSHSGYHVLEVVARRPGEAPPFADIKPLVLGEYRRRAADQALRDYIADLRRRAHIVVAPDLK